MARNQSPQVALVTGANRGIGVEVCRQLGRAGYRVFLAARDEKNASISTSLLKSEGLSVEPLTLDVASERSARQAIDSLTGSVDCLNVLVNNAGIGFDPIDNASHTDLAAAGSIFQTNVFGAWMLSELALPLLLNAAPGSRIVNVSSEAGSFTSDGYFSLRSQPGVAAYAVSKAALNALTIKLANSLKDRGILVNAVCPGWTATYTGAAEQGARPVAEGAASVVWAATLPPDGPTGGFFRDGKPLPW